MQTVGHGDFSSVTEQGGSKLGLWRTSDHFTLLDTPKRRPALALGVKGPHGDLAVLWTEVESMNKTRGFLRVAALAVLALALGGCVVVPFGGYGHGGHGGRHGGHGGHGQGR
jgi:hypothetical protein